MRSASFVLAAALLLVVAVAQGAAAPNSKAENSSTPAITDCAQQMGAAVQGARCSQASLGSTPDFVVSHTVLAHACSTTDLHIIRYIPAGGVADAPAVAAYCD